MKGGGFDEKKTSRRQRSGELENERRKTTSGGHRGKKTASTRVQNKKEAKGGVYRFLTMAYRRGTRGERFLTDM